MAIGDIIPTGGSHRKKPVSKREIERRKKLYKKIPILQQQSEEASREDQKQAEDFLNTHL